MPGPYRGPSGAELCSESVAVRPQELSQAWRMSGKAPGIKFNARLIYNTHLDACFKPSRQELPAELLQATACVWCTTLTSSCLRLVLQT